MISERVSLLRATRLVRWSTRLGLLVVACALGGCASTAASDSPASSRLELDGGVVESHTLPGDQLLAGPVLLDHRAVWVEAGRRLLVRSLDAHGRTRTVFSTSKAPGAPKGTIWPYWVRSIAAGDGRLAFVEAVIQCGSAPPHLPRCAPNTAGAPVDSVTLFAGKPGAIRPVESFVLPSRHCYRRPEPRAVAITDAGLVDYEIAADPCIRGVSRLVLRSFSGRLVRVLARGLPVRNQRFRSRRRLGGIRPVLRNQRTGPTERRSPQHRTYCTATAPTLPAMDRSHGPRSLREIRADDGRRAQF